MRGYEFDTTLYNTGRAITIRTLEVGADQLVLTARYLDGLVFEDTIHSNGLLYIEFPDFDHDGNADILMDYIGNNSNYFLYLYDPVHVRFRSIEGYLSFPDALQLDTDPQYYYSYHRAGCADENWVSDLFRIDDYKIVQLGHIDGKGCSFEEEKTPPVIEIYRVKGNDEDNAELMEKLPYRQYIHDFEDKWDFIHAYWNKNVGRFK